MRSILHLQKLSVGTESVADLAQWQALHRVTKDGYSRHVTRMWPKREEEIVCGGSIYWVIKGVILARQRIHAFEPQQPMFQLMCANLALNGHLNTRVWNCAVTMSSATDG